MPIAMFALEVWAQSGISSIPLVRTSFHGARRNHSGLVYMEGKQSATQRSQRTQRTQRTQGQVHIFHFLHLPEVVAHARQTGPLTVNLICWLEVTRHRTTVSMGRSRSDNCPNRAAAE